MLILTMAVILYGYFISLLDNREIVVNSRPVLDAPLVNFQQCGKSTHLILALSATFEIVSFPEKDFTTKNHVI